MSELQHRTNSLPDRRTHITDPKRSRGRATVMGDVMGLLHRLHASLTFHAFSAKTVVTHHPRASVNANRTRSRLPRFLLISRMSRVGHVPLLPSAKSSLLVLPGSHPRTELCSPPHIAGSCSSLLVL